MSGWWLLAWIVLFIVGSFASAWALAKLLNRQQSLRPPAAQAEPDPSSRDSDHPRA